ncbi:MAG: GGDEF domain-containing protein [Chloroflexi bacterium]|nr:MAG: GGDEF domain-containing protein [Chloroflexota bacterium]
MPRGAAARTDSKVKMDGCLSATEFGSAMAQRWKQAREKGDPVTLLLVDLDSLHELNVTHGRDEGDRAINASLAALAKNAKGERWTLGRVGGDEFALLAPGVATEAAFLRADAIRRELDSAMAKALRRGKVTASIGVASSPRDAKSPDELMRKADLALYAAKGQGGGAVALTPGDDMILKSSYYSSAQLGRLRSLAERMKKKEAVLLREALDDLLRKHERS